MFLKICAECNLIAKSGWDSHLRNILSKGPVGAVVPVPGWQWGDTHPLGTLGEGVPLVVGEQRPSRRAGLGGRFAWPNGGWEAE